MPLFGIGRNDYRAPGFKDYDGYDSNRYEYGGYAGAGQQEKDWLNAQARKAEYRSGIDIDAGARGLARDAALGNAPSEAAILAKAQTDDAIRAGTSLAGSVKGGAGARVAAMRNAQFQQAAQTAQGARTAAAARANEMGTARGQYFGLEGKQADVALGSRGQNDAKEMHYEDARQQINRDQLNASVAQQQILAGDKANRDRLSYGAEQSNADKDDKMLTGFLGAGAGAVGGAIKGIFGSDERMKEGVSMGSLSHMGPAPATFDAMSGGGLDVTGSLQKHSDFATQYASNPGASPAGGSMPGNIVGGAVQGFRSSLEHVPSYGRDLALSDAEAKRKAFRDGVAYADLTPDATSKTELPPYMREQAKAQPQPQRESMGTIVKDSAKDAAMSALGAPGAVAESAIERANRAMKPETYAYKPGFTPPGQQPGEPNVGPIAQNMAKDPVARTAVVQDPQTGLLGIDKEKGLKLVMGGLAGLQNEVDALKKRAGGKR
jgi:hypothetical protein